VFLGINVHAESGASNRTHFTDQSHFKKRSLELSVRSPTLPRSLSVKTTRTNQNRPLLFQLTLDTQIKAEFLVLACFTA